MKRNPEYQYFLDVKNGKIRDDQPNDQEIPASDQEVGWWEKEQLRRALQHARHSIATPEEIALLEKHKIAHSWRAKRRTFRHKEKTHQS